MLDIEALGLTKVNHAPRLDLVTSYAPQGICAAYAFHFLAHETYGTQGRTIDFNNELRVKKLCWVQNEAAWSMGGQMDRLQNAFKLNLGHESTHHYEPESNEFTEMLDGLNGIHYISLQVMTTPDPAASPSSVQSDEDLHRRLMGHGIAYNAKSRKFCDANNGIFKLGDDSTLAAVLANLDQGYRTSNLGQIIGVDITQVTPDLTSKYFDADSDDDDECVRNNQGYDSDFATRQGGERTSPPR